MSANARILAGILKPADAQGLRLLYIAEFAPDEPTLQSKNHPRDGGYPAYHFEIFECLRDLGYAVRSSSKPYSILNAGGNTDFVFSLYNRMPINNSEVFVSAVCEFLRIPYLGARPNIRALAEDKWLSKLVAQSIGLTVAPGLPYSTEPALNIAPDFAGPYFVKNRFGAGSEGITEDCVQDTWTGAKRIAAQFIGSGAQVLVEQYVDGIDITVPVLGGSSPLILGLVNPRSDKPGNILTEDLKMDDPLGYEMYDAKDADKDFRADVTALWTSVGPIDYFRSDYRYHEATGKRVFLEFNICCFLGKSGAICLAGAQWGLSQADILGHVVEYSVRQQRLARQHLQWVL